MEKSIVKSKDIKYKWNTNLCVEIHIYETNNIVNEQDGWVKWKTEIKATEKTHIISHSLATALTTTVVKLKTSAGCISAFKLDKERRREKRIINLELINEFLLFYLFCFFHIYLAKQTTHTLLKHPRYVFISYCY